MVTGSSIISVQLKGVKEVRAKLDQLEPHIKRRLLVDVMKKSLQKTLSEAQARAPIGNPVLRRSKLGYQYSSLPGVLKRSFRIKKMRSSNPFLLEVQLQNTAYYALWVEYGHRIIKGRGKSRRVVGSARPKPFMRPTYESQKQQIINEVNNGIKAGLFRRGL